MVKWIRFKSDKKCVSPSIKNDGRYIKFTDTPIIAESIEEYAYHEYEPITGTSIINGGDIRINTTAYVLYDFETSGS